MCEVFARDDAVLTQEREERDKVLGLEHESDNVTIWIHPAAIERLSLLICGDNWRQFNKV